MCECTCTNYGVSVFLVPPLSVLVYYNIEKNCFQTPVDGLILHKYQICSTEYVIGKWIGGGGRFRLTRSPH